MRQFFRHQIVQTVLINIAVVIVVVLCSPIGWELIRVLQVTSLDRTWHSIARFLLGLLFVLALACFVAAASSPIFTVGFLFCKKYRRYVSACLAAWVLSWSSWSLRHSFSSLRTAGLVKITQRAKPLINAIETYRQQKGHYPNQLQDLVPEFLNGIPYTGAVGYPDFEYQLAKGGSLFLSYEVRVKTPSGGINWDVFVYWPEKNYPSEMYGGSVERIGDWAYVHE